MRTKYFKILFVRQYIIYTFKKIKEKKLSKENNFFDRKYGKYFDITYIKKF